MDKARQDQEGGTSLFTLGLAYCIGIGVCGKYVQKAEPGEIRNNAFLSHLADGPDMEKTWQSLKSKVDLAKSNGLTELKIQVSVVDPLTLKDDESMNWTQPMIVEQQKLNDGYIAKASSLLTAGPQTVGVQRHHINKAVDMRITSDRRILILDS